jgi:hypothetical protein
MPKLNDLIVKERGVRLCTTTSLTTGVSHVAITTEVIEGRKKPKGFHLIPSHCPFCGEKYPDKE